MRTTRCCFCGGPFGLIVHRWRDKRFCSDTGRTQCKKKYREGRIDAGKNLRHELRNRQGETASRRPEMLFKLDTPRS
jgi:hypothetical protein